MGTIDLFLGHLMSNQVILMNKGLGLLTVPAVA